MITIKENQLTAYDNGQAINLPYFANHDILGVVTVDEPVQDTTKLEIDTSSTDEETIYTSTEVDALVNSLYPNTHSTEEVQIGTWIDGKPLYRKVITTTGWNDSTITSRNIAHGITNLEQVLYAYAMGVSKDKSANYVLPYFNGGTAKTYIKNIGGTSVTIANADSWASYTFYITLEYTKTTD